MLPVVHFSGNTQYISRKPAKSLQRNWKRIGYDWEARNLSFQLAEEQRCNKNCTMRKTETEKEQERQRERERE